jgi:signal transduction histidine kinase
MAGLAAYVWRRRFVSGAYALFATLLSIAYLLVVGAIEERSATLAGHVFWQHVQIPGYAAMPVCCLLLALNYAARPPRGWRPVVLFLIPVAGVLVHWTNDWHHLYWVRIWMDRTARIPVMGRTYGAAFWLLVTYSYLMTGISIFVLAGTLVRNRAQRMRTLLFLGAITLPCGASLLYVFEWFPVRYLDITPYALTVTGIVTFWVIFRYRFQGIVPVAARAVVASMADGIVVLDLDRRVADVNPAAQTLLGCSKESLVGRHAATAFRECADLAPYCLGGGKMAGDVSLPAGDRLRTCAASAVDVMQGDHCIGRVITLRDVLAERQASEQLREARQAAEAASIAKSNFLANMSHEIRTPMNGVVGSMELLLDSGLDDEQLELAETAQESAHCLLSIINDILDFSKIDAGKLDLEQVPFDLYRLMDQTVRSMQPIAAKQGLDLRLQIAPDVPRAILGDPTRLRQIVFNLAGNAVKFTTAGWVAIAIERMRAEPGETRISISVEDTGVGIAPDRIGVIFEEFSQADASVTRSFGGTGLGLAISRRLVEKMGGTIRVESTLGRGSKFTVEICVRLADARDVPDSPRVTLSGSERFPGCRVLLAEDNLVNQRICKRVLEKLGCQVQIANDGREAIAVAESAQFDVILMDLQMPGVDGLQATRDIRLRNIQTPIVALTASVLEETRAACKVAGMDAFISKPIRVDEIVAMLRRFSA